jgi:cytochrome P450
VINDFLNVLSTLKKTHPDFTDMDVTAHAAGFFGDGYETSSIAMSFVLFELSCNPEVQDKLRKELESFEEPLSYETLQGFTYLDAVVTESLRKNPPVFSLTKTCTKPYVYRASASDFQNISVSLESGTAVVIPVYALQHDSKYFYDPESFVPERFLDDNKNDLYKYTYLPFGEGPRMCLGQRFGLMQIKAAVAYVIKNFVLTLHKKTQLPLKLNPSYVMMSPLGGLWLNFEKVKN